MVVLKDAQFSRGQVAGKKTWCVFKDAPYEKPWGSLRSTPATRIELGKLISAYS